MYTHGLYFASVYIYMSKHYIYKCLSSFYTHIKLMIVNSKLPVTPKEANLHFRRFCEQAVCWTKKGG